MVVVADKGMTTGDNIWYTLSAKDGYVFSTSVWGADKELKKYVLDQENYEWLGREYIDEKQVVFYSEKYAKRAKADR